ncbi:MAG TPA: energy-coupling factor transporter transmembrane component T [Candidatus Limnocylindrales bacterium]
MTPATEAPVLPDYILRIPTGTFRGLNPLTKLVFAAAAAIVAFGVRGWTGPAVAFVAVVVCGALSGSLRRMALFSLASLPLLVSILVVNTFLYPGAHDTLVVIGPLTATWSGATAALQGLLRVVAFGLSAALFALTTSIDDLMVELERRGLGRRGSYVVGSALGAVPRTLERAREVADAQRGRGMDTEGGPLRRLRGLVPLIGPVVFGALGEVEERAMALEARAFTAPGRRTILRALPDSSRQRMIRWTFLVGSVAAVAASLALPGRLP